jgi:hypothetical protein
MLVFNSNAMNSKDTIIMGKVNNAKYGAVVVTSNNDVYYIDKFKSWSSDYIDKPVMVKGKFVIKKLKKTNVISGGITSPTIKIIKKPKIELFSDS